MSRSRDPVLRAGPAWRQAVLAGSRACCGHRWARAGWCSRRARYTPSSLGVTEGTRTPDLQGHNLRQSAAGRHSPLLLGIHQGGLGLGTSDGPASLGLDRGGAVAPMLPCEESSCGRAAGRRFEHANGPGGSHRGLRSLPGVRCECHGRAITGIGLGGRGFTRRAAGQAGGSRAHAGSGQMTRTFWASSPLRPGPTSNSTVWPSLRDL